MVSLVAMSETQLRVLQKSFDCETLQQFVCPRPLMPQGMLLHSIFQMNYYTGSTYLHMRLLSNFSRMIRSSEWAGLGFAQDSSHA